MYRDYLNNSGGYEHPHSSRYDDRRELYAGNNASGRKHLF